MGDSGKNLVLPAHTWVSIILLKQIITSRKFSKHKLAKNGFHRDSCIYTIFPLELYQETIYSIREISSSGMEIFCQFWSINWCVRPKSGYVTCMNRRYGSSYARVDWRCLARMIRSNRGNVVNNLTFLGWRLQNNMEYSVHCTVTCDCLGSKNIELRLYLMQSSFIVAWLSSQSVTEVSISAGTNSFHVLLMSGDCSWRKFKVVITF